ncbi:hypothetical protein BBJ28_00005714 [Nothophytophthora sp. Chile5]|nr:hypothetical protein BBJ28_00005714 [Nothophytophthora sp. Chile5]
MVVINPAGGAGNAQSTYEQTVAPVLEQANVDVETVITTHAGHATELLADLPLDKFDCVVAVGGDGLLSESESVAVSPCSVVPGGSGNGLSAALLARAGEHNEALNAAYSLAKGSTQELDLFSISNSQDEVMYGFLSLEWAFVANMDVASERFRYFGDSRFLIATVLQIFGLGRKSFPGRLRYLASDEDEPLPEKYHERKDNDAAAARPRCVCLEKDRQTQEEGEEAVAEKTGTWKEMDGPFYMFWGMNVSHAAADAHIAPPAAIDDGYFYMMLVSGPDFSRVGLSRLMMGIEDASHLDVDRVQLVRTRAFTLTASADDDLMCVDGEVFPGPEVKLEVHRGLGRVLSLPTRR